VRFGAAESILTDAHPHIGSDKLPQVVENIRLCILEHGGEYHFDSHVTDIERLGDGSYKVTAEPSDGSIAQPTIYTSKKVILATGHSARDIYHLFHQKGWTIEAKGFALGVRHGEGNSLIFNQLEEFYPKEVAEYKKLLEKMQKVYGITLPEGVTANCTEEQFDTMVRVASGMTPLWENALGKDWQKIMTPEKMREIFKRI